MLKYIFNKYQTANITPSCKALSSSLGFADSPALLSGTAVALSLTWHEALLAPENEKWVPALQPANPEAEFSRKVALLFWSLRSQSKDVDFKLREIEGWQWYLTAVLIMLPLKISSLSFEGLVEAETTESRRWQLAISGISDPRGVAEEVPIQATPPVYLSSE